MEKEIIKKSNIRKVVREFDESISVSRDAEIEIESRIREILQKAIKRAKANRRTTLLGRDI